MCVAEPVQLCLWITFHKVSTHTGFHRYMWLGIFSIELKSIPFYLFLLFSSFMTQHVVICQLLASMLASTGCLLALALSLGSRDVNENWLVIQNFRWISIGELRPALGFLIFTSCSELYSPLSCYLFLHVNFISVCLVAFQRGIDILSYLYLTIMLLRKKEEPNKLNKTMVSFSFLHDSCTCW